jgi:hypothetical protein
MTLITRRQFLKAIGLVTIGGMALGGYAFGLEPMRLRVTKYAVTSKKWPSKLSLRLAVIADLHACEPWMSAARIRSIVDQTNELEPDLVVLLGDYVAGHRWVTSGVNSQEWAEAIGNLSAPLGIHAILGNHDWWEDSNAQKTGSGPVAAHRALENVGIAVYHNEVVRLEKDDSGFWLAGLGDQIALRPSQKFGRSHWQGVDDLPLTLSKVNDNSPVILLAHEPDIFPKVPDRVALTLSGHTHGGQVRLFGYSPVVPSRYGNRYAYGHIIEPGRDDIDHSKHLVVSGGLGCSIAPLRFGMPPEINLIEVHATR